MAKIDNLSIQLYSLRDFGTLDSQLSALAALGFKNVETIGSHLEDAELTKATLDKFGLSAPTGHVNLDDLRSRQSWVVEQAKTIGIEDLYMPAVSPQDRSGSADYWHRLGAELGAMADQLRELGMGLGYHNHDWEFRPLPDGSVPLQHLLDGSRGTNLTFEADLAWIARAGSDPMVWMEQLGTQLRAIHVKDLAPDGQNLNEDGWADIGAGVLDWPTLWRKAKQCGAKWMVLEHDKPADPIRFATTSKTYLQTMPN